MKVQRVWTVRSCRSNGITQFAPKLSSELESITLLIIVKQVHIVKAKVFPVVMYGCESWTIKKPEHQRIDTFELWCWRRLLRVPWTSGRSNQPNQRKSTLNIHWKDWCWSFNTLATWYKAPTHWKKTMMLGNIEDRSIKKWQRMRWLDGIADSNMSFSKFCEMVKDREALCAAIHGITNSQTQLSHCKTT